MIYPYISIGVTIISFFDFQDAKRALRDIGSIYSHCNLFYIKSHFIKENANEVTFIAIQSKEPNQLDNFDTTVKKRKKI